MRFSRETSPEYRMIDQQLNFLLSERRPVAEKVMQNMIDKTKRASSLVENLNSRIRPFIHLKRIIPDDFFVLMKVFFNTKKFRRSEIKERVGKSPLELMTGKEQPDFFELLGY